MGNAVAANEWVMDGTNSKVRGIVWSRATTLIWLKYPWPVLLSRALRGLKNRVIDKKVLYSGNYETFHRAFLRIITIFFWVKISRRHKRYVRLLQKYQDKHLQIFLFRAPKEADRFLARVKKVKEGEQA